MSDVSPRVFLTLDCRQVANAATDQTDSVRGSQDIGYR